MGQMGREGIWAREKMPEKKWRGKSWEDGTGQGKGGITGGRRGGCPRVCSRFVIALRRAEAWSRTAGVSKGALGMLPD